MLFKLAYIISFMENRININKAGCGSAKNPLQNFMSHSEYRSPKVLKRKPQLKPDCSFQRVKKNGKKVDEGQTICYISPKKSIQSQINGSLRSKTFSSVRKPNQNIHNKSTSILDSSQDDQIDLDCQKISAPKNQLANSSKFFKVESQNKLLTKQNQKLKYFCEELNTKLKDSSSKVQRLQQENQYLYQKIQDFKSILAKKTNDLQQFSARLQQKQSRISKYQQSLAQSEKNVKNLGVIIENMKSEQPSFRSLCTQETEDEDKDKQHQLQVYKNKVLELLQKIKYIHVYQNMSNKIKFDYQEEVNKNRILKVQNRKLMKKIQSISQQLEDKQEVWLGLLRRKRADLEFSLELSPDK